LPTHRVCCEACCKRFPCFGGRSIPTDKRASKIILPRVILQPFTLSRARKNSLSQQKIKLDRNRIDQGLNGMFSTHKRQTHTHTQAHTQAHTLTHTASEREREERETDRQTDRQTCRERKMFPVICRSQRKVQSMLVSVFTCLGCVTVHLLVLTKWHTDHASSWQLHHSILCCCRSRTDRDQITRVSSC